MNEYQIIVPVFNEEETLHQILSYAMVSGYLGRIIFVDDASKDSSPAILQEWAYREGVRVITLKKNRKKEGAIRAALELLEREGELAPYTILLDADSMIAPSESGESVDGRIRRAIAHMKARKLGGMGFQIDVVSFDTANIFTYGAYADYAAVQFDHWFAGRQQQLWVISGPGGIFETNHLLSILRSIVPDFETGDLLITVELMKQKLPIEYYRDISVDTLVPTSFGAHFNQRRRWERGTTKVLWNERRFYAGLFLRPSLLAVLTLVHFSLHLGLLASLLMLTRSAISAGDMVAIVACSMVVWFAISVLKGFWLKATRPRFPLFRYFICALGNGWLWTFVTTPARITGFVEGVVHLVTGHQGSFGACSADLDDCVRLPTQR